MSNLIPVFQVSECTELLSRHLSLLGQINVEGEISQLKISQHKWVFITLKDQFSSIEVFGMIFQIPSLRSIEVGMKVQIKATPQVYKRSGKLSLSLSAIKPVGEGALARSEDLLKQSLKKEGLFDDRFKKDLPYIPEKVVLITAQGSEAYNDFIKISKHRMPTIKVVHIPVSVQGTNAVGDIVTAIRKAHQFDDVSVIVLTRGGGSKEDLSAFNTEEVARAVFDSQIPIVTAIGHEGDTSLSDLTADVRASTPSNAAELVVPTVKEIFNLIENSLQTIRSTVQSKIHHKQITNQRLTHTLYHSSTRKSNTLNKLLETFYTTIENTQQEISVLISSVDQHKRLLSQLHPENLLQKGYSITMTNEGKIITSSQMIHKDDIIQTRLKDSIIRSQVLDKT